MKNVKFLVGLCLAFICGERQFFYMFFCSHIILAEIVCPQANFYCWYFTSLLCSSIFSLREERAFKHAVRWDTRRRLETNWQKMSEMKRARELEDRLRSLSPGGLLHEQCDRYNRCHQCKRRVHNCGETNIWSESRYISGSRIMV